jgi:hypothetical protein
VRIRVLDVDGERVDTWCAPVLIAGTRPYPRGESSWSALEPELIEHDRGPSTTFGDLPPGAYTVLLPLRTIAGMSPVARAIEVPRTGPFQVTIRLPFRYVELP